MKAINNQRLIARFLQLAAIESPSYGERDLADAIIKELDNLGLSHEEDQAGTLLGGNAGNLIVRVPGTLDLPPLLFCAHMDTVTPVLGKRPILHEDGTISSGGDTVLGADDLTGVSAILEAVSVILEQNLPHRPLELVFTIAEEDYTRGGHHLDVSRLQANQAYVLDLAGAPGRVAVQAPGILSFRAEFIGRSAHAGENPEAGIHAIRAAAKAIAQVPCGHVDETTTVNIGTIHGGRAINVVPDSCILEGEIRSLADGGLLSCWEQIAELLTTCAQAEGATVKMEYEVRLEPYSVSTDSPLFLRFARACSDVGLSPSLCKVFGGSDANALHKNGIPGIVLANSMYNIHSCSEYTRVEEITQVAQLVLSMMLDTQ